MPKPRKMLPDWYAPYIQALARAMEGQSKATLGAWAVGYCESELLPLWENYRPDDVRPRAALDAARRWLRGEIKLPEAKRHILACHEAAREAEDSPVAQAAARAIGKSASTIHSARHSIGLALYGALAVAYEALGAGAPWNRVEPRAAEECARMLAALEAISVEHEPNPAKIDWKC